MISSFHLFSHPSLPFHLQLLLPGLRRRCSFELSNLRIPKKNDRKKNHKINNFLVLEWETCFVTKLVVIDAMVCDFSVSVSHLLGHGERWLYIVAKIHSQLHASYLFIFRNKHWEYDAKHNRSLQLRKQNTAFVSLSLFFFSKEIFYSIIQYFSY